MNPIQLFLNTPLLIFVLARLLVKPAGAVGYENYLDWWNMYQKLNHSFPEFYGMNRIQKRLFNKLMNMIDAEMKAISDCMTKGVAVVNPTGGNDEDRS